MTNEQLKKQAIQQAYGEYWEATIKFVDENGWYSMPNGKRTEAFYDFLGRCDMRRELDFRPKSLKGIESNNGWTRIEQDGSNLPGNGKFKVGMKFYDSNIFSEEESIYDYIEVLNAYSMGLCTHYRPVVEHPKPVY